MQFQVPQFIETEDKIIGPLTIKQFLYVGTSAGISFLLYFPLQTWLWVILAIGLNLVGVALAFIKINGRPLVNVVLSALRFYWQPQTFIWQPEGRKIKPDEVTPQPKKPGFSLESLVSGLALKSRWQKVQTGSKSEEEAPAKISPVSLVTKKIKERYQVFEKITGERKAARRVDYR